MPEELFKGLPPSQWSAISQAYYRGVADAERIHPEHCTGCGRYHLPGIGPDCPYAGVTVTVIKGEPL